MTPVPITLNGEMTTAAETHLGQLLARLGIDEATGGVAVAVNDAVVPRSHWDATPLCAGDRIEIVRATAGG